MHATTTALLSFLFVAGSALAAPLGRAAQTSPIACTNSTATTDLGAELEGLQSFLDRINPLEGIVDPAPIFSAQLNALSASAITSQLESLALFPTLPPANPPVATALDDLSKSLGTIQAFVANITVGGFFPPEILGNNTANLDKATQSISNAIDLSKALGCSLQN
ncbi:hypothetical protein C8F01DRAFT_1295708 [Mycena amicta]|nr:hypothetical protein C8F01DRAFT_1295708 [Mycena amicta]